MLPIKWMIIKICSLSHPGKTGIITIAPIEGDSDVSVHHGPQGGEVHPSAPIRNKWGKIKKKDIAVFQVCEAD